MVRAGIFISHRRDDSAAQARNLAQALREQAWPVFMDIDSIGYGESIPRVIERSMFSTGVLAVLIGQAWRGESQFGGRSRLDDLSDFIRLEIEMARAQEVAILPILVDNAVMPREHEVPATLRELVHTRAVKFRHDDYRIDTHLVCSTIDNLMSRRGLGVRSGRIGNRECERGQQVRLSGAEGWFPSKTTGGSAVVLGRQSGTVIGFHGSRVLVRWDAQSWTQSVLGKSTLIKRVDLGKFDAWVEARCLKLR